MFLKYARRLKQKYTNENRLYLRFVKVIDHKTKTSD